ncbi:hypothetical protein HYPSUDRAFT_64887 [Hypholoma sublateritium FD-334 SS-4]|uniref:MARVEL domain-containing protein n=1 Tax=Hypholoma sublateritium (strain FD-334 SS-4) TaxID=945553 RepID=A0A0D2P9N2_HYPSF|nr:hypothetical protein HYPSUDRAFT_64887 [Hypholoma sublateritium FD-334 SS-4]
MIVVDPTDAEANADAASVRTLVSSPKFHHYFPALAISSLPISTVALICAILNRSGSPFGNGNLNGLLTILAFTLSLPYQVVAILLVWLNKHQIASILSFNPSSLRSIAYSAFLALMWVGSVILAAWLIATGGNIDDCIRDTLCYPDWKDIDQSNANIVVTLVLSAVEVLVFGGMTVICYMHKQSLTSSAAPMPETRQSGPSLGTKAISA